MTGIEKEFNEMSKNNYDNLINIWIPFYDELILNSLRYIPKNTSSILELGCGSGNLTFELKKKCNNVSVVELSEKMLEICKKKVNGIKGYKNDMTKIKFENNSFDVIISTLAIHHLLDVEKQKLFNKIKKWLKPGGMFIITDSMNSDNDFLDNISIEYYKKLIKENGCTQQQFEYLENHRLNYDHITTKKNHLSWLSKCNYNSVNCIWTNILFSTIICIK